MIDDELLELQSQWRQGDVDMERVRIRACRDDRRYRLLTILEYLTAALLLGGSLVLAFRRGDVDVWMWAAAIWLLAVPALAFTVWNRRGLWGGSGLDAQAHLRLSLRRCRRSLLNLKVGYGVLAASAAVVVLFAVGVLGSQRNVQLTMLFWLAVLVAVYLALMVWMHRRLRRRRQALLALARELEPPGL